MVGSPVGNSKQAIIGLILLVVFLGVCAWVTWYISQQPAREEVNTAAGEALKDSEETPYTRLDGSPFSFSDVRGQVRVVTVWASWVPQSETELATLNALAERFAEDGIVFLAVNRKEPPRRIEAFLHQAPSFDSLEIIIDETDAYYAAAEGYAMPETRVYDKDGNIVLELRGPITEEQIVDTLEPILQ